MQVPVPMAGDPTPGFIVTVGPPLLARAPRRGLVLLASLTPLSAQVAPESMLCPKVIIGPTQRLVKRLRALGVTVPIIGFPRGAGVQLTAYAHETGVTALGIDTQTPAAAAIAAAPKGMPLQGNLDPLALVVGGDALEKAARDVIEAFKGVPHIFNLGHGITPQATPENMARLIQVVKGGV